MACFCSVKLTNLLASTNVGDDKCIIESDPNKARNYLIYLQNNPSNEKTLFGELSYEFCGYANYLYTIVIGRKLYKVRSCDLKDRRLAIIDTIEQNNSDSYAGIECPETLFQVTDSFSKSNKTYHVTVNDKEKQLGYLAIIILLDLHECKRE